MVSHRPKNIRQLTLYTTGALLAGFALSSCAQPGDATAPELHNSALHGSSPAHQAPAGSDSAQNAQPNENPAVAEDRQSRVPGNRANKQQPRPQSPDRCHTSQLDGSVTSTDRGAGQRYADLTLRNHSGETCTLYGYGGLQLTDGNGQPIPTNLERTANPGPKIVQLAPGDTASATLRWSVVPHGDEPTDGQCQPNPVAASVTPPDETDSLPITWNLGFVCGSGTIQDSAYQ